MCIARVGYHSKARPDAVVRRLNARTVDTTPHAMRTTAREPRAGTPPAPETAERPSKTQRKEMMHALQDLGRELVELDPSRVATLGLSEQLSEAITLARKLTRHEAKRRQMQYIGRLMRDVDPQPLIDALTRWSGGARRGSGSRSAPSRDAGSR